MQWAQVMEGLFQKKASFLITYSIEIFYFHIYHEDFYGLSNNVLHVLGTRLFLYVLATSKIRQCNVMYSKRASHGMFLINNKCVF